MRSFSSSSSSPPRRRVRTASASASAFAAGSSSPILPLLLLLLAAMMTTSTSPAKCGTVKHVHLSVSHEPSSSVTISFASSHCDDDVAHRSFDPYLTGVVFLGPKPDDLNRIVKEKSPATRYNATLPGKKTKRRYDSDFFHHVEVDGLEAETRYYYRCAVSRIPGGVEERWKRRDLRDDDGGGVRSFVTAPLPGNAPSSSEKTLKMAIVGDLGQSEHSMKTVERLNDQRHELCAVVLAGDIAYTKLDHRSWDAWFDLMDDYPVMSELPLQVAAGNHEIDQTEASGELFVAYERRFAMPRIAEAEASPYVKEIEMAHVPYPFHYDYGNSYYAFTYGTTKHVVLNSYANFDPGSNQYEWLASELNDVDRDVTPWVFVTTHVPIYNTFRWHRRDEQLLAQKKHLEPLFVKHKVNAVFSGHIHAYMRTHPVVYDEPDPKGPVYVVVGNGGRQVYAPFYDERPERWVAARDAAIYGYGTLEILNRTVARWDWIHTGQGAENNLAWCRKSREEGCVPGPKGGKALYKELPIGEEDGAYLRNQFYL